MTIGERIRAARELRKLTQREVGERSGIAEPTIRRYELGKLNPKYETLQRIAEALDVSVSYLTQVDVDCIDIELQRTVLHKIRQRIDDALSDVDPADFYEVFGTYSLDEVFGDIYEGRTPLSKERLLGVSEELGVTFDYLMGYTDDPLLDDNESS